MNAQWWAPAPEAANAFRVVALPFLALQAALSSVRVRGAENIPQTGPVIIVSNHTVHLDAVSVGAAVYRAGRAPCFAAGSDFFGVPGLDYILDKLGAIPVYREGPNTAGSLDGLREALDDGRALVLFPEGTFTRDPELWPMRGKTGVVRLALSRPDVPIIPVAHWGNELIMHPWTKRIRWSLVGRGRNTVDVLFGQPLRLPLVTHTAVGGERADAGITYEDLTAATEVVMSEIEKLLVELRKSQPMGMSISPRERRWDRGVDGDPNSELDTRNKARRKKLTKMWQRLRGRA